MTVTNKTIDFILSKIMEKGYDGFKFGLRKDDTIYEPGGKPRLSSHWYDCDWENATPLNGTCVTSIDYDSCFFHEDDYYDSEEELEEAREELREAIREAASINKDYIGQNWYIIYGTDADEGADENELVIKDATVLCKIECS